MRPTNMIMVVLGFALFVFSTACGGSSSASGPLPLGHHEDLGDYKWEVRMVDDGEYTQSFYTDTEPVWLLGSCPPVIRIQNFRRYPNDLEPRFGPTFDVLSDKDQRIERIQKR